MQNTKICCNCLQELNLDNFYITKDGIIFYICKECNKSRDRLRDKRPRKTSRRKNTVKTEEGFKFCPHCSQILPNDKFSINRSNKSGLSSKCKACAKIHREKTNRNVNVDEKQCGTCKLIKPSNDFSKCGHSSTGLSHSCKSCNNISHKKLYENNKEFYRKKNKDSYYQTDIYLRWANRTLNNHKNRGVNILITSDRLIELAKLAKYCAFCNCELRWSGGDKKRVIVANSPSLENLDCKHELEEKDIEIICSRCNTSKSDRTLSEYIDYIKSIIPNLENIQLERSKI